MGGVGIWMIDNFFYTFKIINRAEKKTVLKILNLCQKEQKWQRKFCERGGKHNFFIIYIKEANNNLKKKWSKTTKNLKNV